MKKTFDVLNRSLNLKRNYLLEASAGTGKTFSIQHLVVRLLIEHEEDAEPIAIDKILVVTFTRAATRDLKIRIRKTIEESLNFLDASEEEAGKIPDYLKACIDKGEHEVSLAKKRLQQALFLFEQAQIFTIHSFCARMLRQFSMESDTGLQTTPGDNPFPKSELIAVIRDFFRTEIRQGKFSAAQIERYLNNDPDQIKLLNMIQSGHDMVASPTFEEAHIHFNHLMKDLKASYQLISDKMIEDFRKQAPFYSNYSKETKAQTFEKICSFANLFTQEEWSCENLDRLIRDGLVWTKALNPSLLKKDPQESLGLSYPTLTQELAATLSPLIEETGDFSLILARMAHECRHHLRRYQLEEEKHSPDDVLGKMHVALDQPLFLNRVRTNYQAVIVDEFQDTDPLQWRIFSRLFLPMEHSWKGNIILVGDPKQSIYSFRQADIYTYLAAAKAIGENNCLSLSVNFRSHASLVQGLNLLFAQENLPSFIPLPKHSTHLPCQPVQAAKKGQLFDDKRGAIHFMVADCQAMNKPNLQKMENHVFFPYIFSEIMRLHQQKGLMFSQFAVLVRDRHQALRLTEFLGKMDIPILNQRGTSLARSPALSAFSHLIQALLHPKDRGKVLTAFGSPLLGWTETEFQNPESMDFILPYIQRLRASLFEKSFSQFFHELLHSYHKPSGPTLQEHLLAGKNGVEFTRDLLQLSDCLLEHQLVEWDSPEGILSFLDHFHLWEQNEDERAKRFEDPGKDGVKILTLHMSKGLEFDVVFALGLVNRHDIKDDLIPIASDDQVILSPIVKESSAYRQHCEECDSEKMRQLYVALTRARHQLYVPAVLHFPSEKLKWGEASPIELFLARLHQPPASYPIFYERIRGGTDHILIDFIEKIGKDNFITYSVHQEVFCKDENNTSSVPAHCLLQPPVHVPVSGNALWISSFTSLSQHAVQPSLKKQNTAPSAPSAFGCATKNVHTLPTGSDTGILIHRILEKLVFNHVEPLIEPEQAVPLVRPFIQSTPLKEWEQTIAQLIFNTLKTPLPTMDSSFSLSRINPGSLYREMSFLFPYQRREGIEDIHFKEGMIKGEIDMLFFHEGLYYLVDWKTNWLGPQPESYQTAALHTAMQANNYYLQASLYVQAIKRYLELVDKRKFSECFGGVFYLFLRGMQVDQSTGIVHFFPDYCS